MQGEKGSLRDLQRYHRGADSNKRRLLISKGQIPEEDEVDGRKNNDTSSDATKSANLPKIPKPNLSNKSPKASPRGKPSDKDLIREEEGQEKGDLCFKVKVWPTWPIIIFPCIYVRMIIFGI